MQNKAKFLTIAQAAEFLKISPDTLRRWEAKGIVTPHRTKGGSRRYTLLDLKIAKLNKRKVRFLQLPTLISQNYINSKRDLRIALVTSFLWIFGILIFHFLTPVFLRPTNPQQRILSDQLKQQAGLKVASDTTPTKVNVIKVLVIPDQTPVVGKTNPQTTDLESGLLILQGNSSSTLQYTDAPNQYYSLQPLPAGRQVLPQNQIPTLIKRN